MRKLLKVFVFGMLLVPFVSFADSMALRWENDCFIKHSDSDYSNGIGLEYWYQELWKFTLQQNMYTPNDISLPYHVPGDRPYAGWLGAGIGRRLFAEDGSPWSHYAEIDFGMVGPSAHAGEVQDMFHRWCKCTRPQGWDTQLRDEFCVNGQWWTKYNWYICDYVALIPRGGVLAGTLQDAAELGCDLKVGWNIRKHQDVGPTPMFSATNPNSSKFWDHVIAYATCGGDCRYYLYNHFLEGSFFNSRDKDVTVDIEPFVGEFTFGAYLEVYGVFVSYYGLLRTHEYKTQKESPDYGGLMFGYRWNF